MTTIRNYCSENFFLYFNGVIPKFSLNSEINREKFLLWFEPERIAQTSVFFKKHPEHLLTCKGDKSNALLNLGVQNTWDYCCNMLKEHISELKLDCLRVDFLFQFRFADKPAVISHFPLKAGTLRIKTT